MNELQVRQVLGAAGTAVTVRTPGPVTCSSGQPFSAYPGMIYKYHFLYVPLCESGLGTLQCVTEKLSG